MRRRLFTIVCKGRDLGERMRFLLEKIGEGS